MTVRQNKVKIGSVELDGCIAVAPMAGVTDRSYRQILSEFGASLLTTEMVSAKAILYGNKKTEELMDTRGVSCINAVQLFGADPDIMAEIAAKVQESFRIIDVNMGCPVPKVVRNGEGSALMQTPGLAAQILRKMVGNTHVPITVKFRKGFDHENINCVEFAKMAEQAGVSAVTVHGRTREQYYSGKADWEILGKVKAAVSIPVFGNGDIFQPQDALRMMEESGVDGVALARGVQGNPWLVRRLREALESGILPLEPTVQEKKEVIRDHLRRLIEEKGEHTAILEMRKHISWYTEGMPNSARFRFAVNHAESAREMLKLLEKMS